MNSLTIQTCYIISRLSGHEKISASDEMDAWPAAFRSQARATAYVWSSRSHHREHENDKLVSMQTWSRNFNLGLNKLPPFLRGTSCS
jgi:hypothetical protein